MERLTGRVEKSARIFVEDVVRRYGVTGALSRTRIMSHDRSYRGRPKWLVRSIEILELMEKEGK